MRHGAVIPLVYNVTRWDTTQGSEGIGAAGTSRTSRRPPSRGGRGISGPVNGFCKGNLPGRVLGGREVPAPSGKASTGGFSGWGQLFPHRTMRHADPSPALHAGSTLPLPSPAAHPPTHLSRLLPGFPSEVERNKQHPAMPWHPPGAHSGHQSLSRSSQPPMALCFSPREGVTLHVPPRLSRRRWGW